MSVVTESTRLPVTTTNHQMDVFHRPGPRPVIPRAEDDDELNRFMDFLDILWEVLVIEMRNMTRRLPSLNIRSHCHRVHRRMIGDHRSLIRAVGTALPLPPYGRFIINHWAVDRFSVENTDNEATVATLNELIDVLYTEATPGVITRTRIDNDDPISVPECDDVMMSMAPSTARPFVPCFVGLTASRASTPIHADGTSIAFGQSAMSEAGDQDNRINQLEMELAKLREQMLMMVQMTEASGLQQPRRQCISPGSDSGVDEQDPTSSVTSSSVVGIKPAPIVRGPPAPPPPPPPPAVMMTPTKRPQLIRPKQRRPSKEEVAKTHHAASFADVLSELKVAKLKRTTDRSPGGTPRRSRRSAHQAQQLTDPTDPGAFLMAALQKKFATVHALAAEDSPSNSECNRLNMSSGSGWASSPDSSPVRCR